MINEQNRAKKRTVPDGKKDAGLAPYLLAVVEAMRFPIPYTTEKHSVPGAPAAHVKEVHLRFDCCTD